jgi:hypothetical protein
MAECTEKLRNNVNKGTTMTTPLAPVRPVETPVIRPMRSIMMMVTVDSMLERFLASLFAS